MLTQNLLETELMSRPMLEKKEPRDVVGLYYCLTNLSPSEARPFSNDKSGYNWGLPKHYI
jgi:hypothetical protein